MQHFYEKKIKFFLFVALSDPFSYYKELFKVKIIVAFLIPLPCEIL